MNRDTLQKILLGLFVTACIFIGVQVFDVETTMDNSSSQTQVVATSSSSRMTYGRFLEL